MTDDIKTPWLTMREASQYAKRGRRFFAREIRTGRLRAAQVGGRGEFVTKSVWIDEWLDAMTRYAVFAPRRIARR